MSDQDTPRSQAEVKALARAQAEKRAKSMENAKLYAAEFEAKTGDAAYKPWLEAMMVVAKHYRLNCSEENVRLASQWSEERSISDVLRSMARQAGMLLKVTQLKREELTAWRLPMIVQFKGGQVAVLEILDNDGNIGLLLSGDQGLKTSISIDELLANAQTAVILRPSHTVQDSRIDDYIKPHEPNWFRKMVMRDWKPYAHIMLASLLANILALSGILFTRQVYDRVIPAESYPTLYVLFTGVMIAIVFDFILRKIRSKVTDLLGKRADMRISDRVFGHALRIKNASRPRSTGTFISQIRELESVRELLTSTTVTAFADMPFFFLFCIVMWYIAGPIALVPIVAVLLMVIPGLLAQRKLRAYADEAMRESSLRNAMLVEAVQGIEDIKSLQAEQRFQYQWNNYNAVSAEVALRLRSLVSTLSVWTQNIQTAVFAIVVLFGAPMVIEGDLTTGSLIAASILSSRMIGPMAQLTQVLSRWQQAKVGLKSINSLMELPVDNPEAAHKVHRPVINGHYQVKHALFKYGEEAKTPVLELKDLTIKAGEKIAILGRNGAGKSTLLQVLAGSLEPAQGEILLDGVSLQHIDPADVRRDVGILTQNSRLFHGTIRENLLLGAPNATDKEILGSLAMSGAIDFIQKLPDGMDHMILEGGLGLSGGQRQSLLLARLLIRQPHIVLLDEPTASLDDATEKRFIQQLDEWLGNRTFLVATHRMRVLSIVERIIVVDDGKIVMDDTKQNILAHLSGQTAGNA